MVRFLGYARLPGFCLKYFVFGNNRNGYCIRIVEKDDNWESQVEQYVSKKLSDTLFLAYKLRRCSVFPENLPEILEDLRFDQTHSSSLPEQTAFSPSFAPESGNVLA